ncbi:hypothetical protein [Thermoanaerobacterium thermosaccharolyticum]|nr:hypothetical protein [Thermoanaerobacterium thermosaccharolyticum]MCP2240863.1 ABC-type branched-subunit amino acid transport system ATPase component [Thermoanaerobacterium thermosaccharolyticum]TCW32065.1 hypothetical protein EDC21_1297 [Thermohydrogenium kirishiense]
MLEIENLNVSYGMVNALKGIFKTIKKHKRRRHNYTFSRAKC